MTINILIIGNSHSGALKAGQQQLELENELDHMNIDFLALSGKYFRRLSIFDKIISLPEDPTDDVGQKQWHNSYGHSQTIDLNKYHFVIMAGGICTMNFRFYYSGNNVTHLSASMLGKIQDNIIYCNQYSEASEIFYKIGYAIHDKLIYLGTPLPSSKFYKEQEVASIFKGPIRKVLERNASIIRARAENKLLARHFPVAVPPLEQLLDVNFVSTRHEFIHNGLNATNIAKNIDLDHANGNYGKQMLQYIYKNLSLIG